MKRSHRLSSGFVDTLGLLDRLAQPDDWAVVKARRLDRIAQAGGGFTVDRLDGRPPEYFKRSEQ